MNDEELNDIDVPLIKMTDAEIARDLYRYIEVLIESKRRERPSDLPRGGDDSAVR